jgi:hypothetical protein
MKCGPIYLCKEGNTASEISKFETLGIVVNAVSYSGKEWSSNFPLKTCVIVSYDCLSLKFLLNMVNLSQLTN